MKKEAGHHKDLAQDGVGDERRENEIEKTWRIMVRVLLERGHRKTKQPRVMSYKKRCWPTTAQPTFSLRPPK
jgi:hypothetical protein